LKKGLFISKLEAEKCLSLANAKAHKDRRSDSTFGLSMFENVSKK
jgi:hypothetical protein